VICRRPRRDRLPDCATVGCLRKVGDGLSPAVLISRDRTVLLCGECGRDVAFVAASLGTAAGVLNGIPCYLDVYSFDVFRHFPRA
jgi:hypothetical protein